VEISGIPTGGTLNHGTENAGVWTVAGADLATLALTPPTGFSGPLNLSVVARSTETSNSSTAVSAAQTLTVIVPIIGTNGDDTLTGTANADLIFGLDGNDIIDPQGGNDTVHAGNGNDFISGSLGSDLIDGGAGLDRVSYANASAAITVMLAAGTITAGASTDTLQSVEFVRGSANNDSYDATGFNGSSANAGSNGTFNEFEGMGGNDTITGNGNTRISYVNATAGVDVTLSTGVITGDLSVGTDQIVGGVNAVRGSQFDDIIRGAGANETLDGQDGNDQLGGGPGNDTLIGGNGFDTALYGLAGSSVTVNLATGTATGASSGNDSLSGIEAVLGSTFSDTLIGDGQNNTLDGNNGNDVLQGGAGNDTLIGQGGIDIAVFSGLRSASTFSAGQVVGPDGTDSTNSIELLQFDDAFLLGYGLTPINLSGFVLPNLNPLFGRAVADFLSVDSQVTNGRLIDLGGDVDTLTLAEFGSPTYNLNISNVENINSTGGIETVNLQNAVSGLSVDLGGGFDTLNLANGNNMVATTNVEFINGGSGDDIVTYIQDGSVTNQKVDLGLGTNVLNLAGADSNFVMSIAGSNLAVNGLTTGGNEDIQLLNVQAGTTFNLGAGTDSITLWNDFSSVNVLTVLDVEDVQGSGFQSDQIHIAGNAGGVTTVTAAGGADLMWASGDEDHFRYTSMSDSPYDIPFGGQRDVIYDFNAAQDQIVLDNIPGTLNWEVTNFGGATILRMDFNGDAVGDNNWDMAIQLENLQGTLTSANFLLV
jgi:Ca2+-binding RTX toxin-like protein